MAAFWRHRGHRRHPLPPRGSLARQTWHTRCPQEVTANVSEVKVSRQTGPAQGQARLPLIIMKGM